LQNYHYAVIPKNSGSPRLIESPKSQLKEIQRRILREILSDAPVHDRAHGYVRGRSCLSSAQVHAGEYVVAAVDLKHFFTSVGTPRIHGLFRSIGYPWAVARLLTGLCMTATPLSVLTQSALHYDWEARKLFNAPHLPQGAPTSPALANLCAWTLDQRLAALGSHFGANYSRYADDMAFSGDRTFARQIRKFLAGVETIVASQGFVFNKSKTRIMRSSSRQRITGIVVNDHVNVDRNTYDRLKAALYNCTVHGVSEQNRDGHPDFRSHLNGRVGWVEQVNPNRGVRLREMFDRIVW
jgi:retron-type reverse transcriptase